MAPRQIAAALDRLMVKARDADHAANEFVTVSTSDLVTALQELDRCGVIDLDMD